MLHRTQRSFHQRLRSKRQVLCGSKAVVLKQGGSAVSRLNSGVSFSLGAAGNQLGDGLRKFDYDASNRHSKTGIHDSDEGAKTTYLYNALGQRVFKSEPQVDYTAPNEAVLGTDFVTWLKNNFKWLFATAQGNASLGSSYAYAEADANLPAWALLGEYNNGSASGTGRTEYIWLPTEDGSAIPVGMYRSNRYWNIHSDHLGTPRLVTDDTAKPVWQLPYSAFGDNKPMGVLGATTNPNTAISAAPLLKATSPAVVLNLRFPGQYWDSETNLNYNLNRTYQPTTGRYTQADPIGLEGGWNRYAYVDGNPLWASDPEGLAWQNNLREIAFCILCLANNRRIPPPPPPPPPVMAPRPAVPDKCS